MYCFRRDSRVSLREEALLQDGLEVNRRGIVSGAAVRFIASFFKSLLFFLERLQAVPELIKRARNVAVLRVSTEVEFLGTLLL